MHFILKWFLDVIWCKSDVNSIRFFCKNMQNRKWNQNGSKLEIHLVDFWIHLVDFLDTFGRFLDTFGRFLDIFSRLLDTFGRFSNTFQSCWLFHLQMSWCIVTFGILFYCRKRNAIIRIISTEGVGQGHCSMQLHKAQNYIH